MLIVTLMVPSIRDDDFVVKCDDDTQLTWSYIFMLIITTWRQEKHVMFKTPFYVYNIANGVSQGQWAVNTLYPAGKAYECIYS